MIEWHLRAIGLLMLLIAGVHAFFPSWFRWREELNRLSLLNRQIFVVHTLFVVLILVLVGSLLLFHGGTILRSGELGRVIYLGLGVFWAARLAVQLWYYDRTLWQGDTAKTGLHALISLLCGYFTAVFAWASFATVVR
jgi:hypothetical protein